MKNKSFLLALAMVAFVHVANADIIIAPTTATSTVAGSNSSSPTDLINSTGLSAAVNTGDDTATVVSSITHAYPTFPNLSSIYYANTTTGPTLTFGLGGSYDNIDSILVWNYPYGNGSNNATKTFSLSFFSDAGATAQIGSTVSGLELAIAQNPEVAQQVSFGGGLMFDGVQSVKMTLVDQHTGTKFGLGEVRFSAIPEPSSLALILSAFGILYLRRRRRR